MIKKTTQKLIQATTDMFYIGDKPEEVCQKRLQQINHLRDFILEYKDTLTKSIPIDFCNAKCFAMVTNNCQAQLIFSLRFKTHKIRKIFYKRLNFQDDINEHGLEKAYDGLAITLARNACHYIKSHEEIGEALSGKYRKLRKMQVIVITPYRAKQFALDANEFFVCDIK